MADIILRGDTALWRIEIVNAETMEPHDLSGCTVWGTVKDNTDTPDQDALFMHSITIEANGSVSHADGMTLVGPAADGVVEQELTPAVSSQLEVGDYIADVQVMTADGRIFTPIANEAVQVVPDLTRAITRPE